MSAPRRPICFRPRAGKWKAGRVRRSRPRNWRRSRTRFVQSTSPIVATRAGGGQPVRRGDPLRQLRRRRGGELSARLFRRRATIFSQDCSRAGSFTRAAHQFTPRPTANGSMKRARPNRSMRRAKSCAKTEEFVRQNGGLVARLAGIYGPGRSALLRKFLSGEARIDNDGQRYLNQVHRDDIAAALLHLVASSIERSSAASIVNVTDDRADYPARSVRVAGEQNWIVPFPQSLPGRRTKTRREQQAGVEPKAARARLGAKISDLSDRNGEVGPASVSGTRRLKVRPRQCHLRRWK